MSVLEHREVSLNILNILQYCPAFPAPLQWLPLTAPAEGSISKPCPVLKGGSELAAQIL